MYSQSRFALLSLALALVVIAGFTHPAQAGTIFSTADLPLSGSFYDSVTGENVLITGALHLDLVTISPKDPISGLREATVDGVLVQYLEGVAAEPIIIGSVYNGTESILPGSIFYLVYGSISSKTTAIGQTSGVPYVINGMNILQIAQPPSDTIAPTTRNMVISSVIYPTAPIGGIGVNVLGDNTYSGATVVLAGKGTVILGDSLVTVYPFDTIVPCVGN